MNVFVFLSPAYSGILIHLSPVFSLFSIYLIIFIFHTCFLLFDLIDFNKIAYFLIYNFKMFF